MPKSRHLLPLLLAAAAACTGLPARAADPDVPAWAAMGKEQTNMRVGPGREYRISWTYVRKGLPVKVLRQMGGWWLVEDPDGARGWVLAQFVSRKLHTGMVRGQPTEIRESRDGGGRVLWRAAPGVIGHLGACDNGWCAFDIDGRKGYVAQSAVWGAGAP